MSANVKLLERCFENPYQDYSKDTFKLNDNYLGNKFEQMIVNYIQVIIEEKTFHSDHSNTSTFLNQRADVYVGMSGIAFMFHKMSKSPHCQGIHSLEYAERYSKAAIMKSKDSRSDKLISLLSGDAGIYFVGTAVMKAIQKPHHIELKESLKGMKCFENPAYLTDGRSEMLVGRCGYLLGLLWLQKQLDEEIVSSRELSDMAKVLMKSGKNYSKKYGRLVPLMYQYHGKEYLGAAHGISAILFALLKTDLSPKDLEDVKSTIDELLKLQNEDGNFPSKYDTPENYHLIHWCHGAPGMFFLMAKAFLKFGDDKYLESCIKCGDLIWKYGLLKKGPGICHGVAGNGYVHLLLYRLTKDDKHLYRARKFAEFLNEESFKINSRTPDRPYSLFEGLSGTICFLIDLLEPKKAEFPFMDIF